MISLDFETRSRCDLKACGAYRYAEDPSTEILVIAVSKDGGPTEAWDIRQPVERNLALELLRLAIEEKQEIHAFNAQFEYVILKYVAARQLGLPVPDIGTLRCTSAVARIAGCPPGLAKTGEFLRIPQEKDKIGSALIRLFSIPAKDGTFLSPTSDKMVTTGGVKMKAGEAFDRFVEYCRRDVIAEQQVAEALAPFALKGDMLEAFLFDLRMNDRGVPVDVPTLRHAQTLVEEHERRLTTEFQGLTGFAPGQRDRVLGWLQEEGYQGDSLDKEARAAFGGDDSLSSQGKAALDLKAQLSFAAVKKIKAMLDMVMSDGRIRGSFLFYGAQKTGRWTNQKVQFQNMKKPPKRVRGFINSAYADVAAGIDLDTFRDFYGDPYEILACLVRYFVRPDNGVGVYDLDFASVEARILPMLIGAERILDKVRRDEDLYIGLRDRLRAEFPHYDFIDRDIAKTITLACQFDGGKNAVNTATNGRFTEAECAKVAKMVREENPEFQPAWRRFLDCWVEAFRNPGRWVEVTKHVAFGYSVTKPFRRMLMRLPSGRRITYPYPEAKPITMALLVEKTWVGDGVFEDRESWVRLDGHLTTAECGEKLNTKANGSFFPEGNVVKSFHSHDLSFYGHVKDSHYGRVQTRGGDLLQSATQATGVDLLIHGCTLAERSGLDPWFVVHDQVLTTARGGIDTLERCATTVPEWFKGFPLGAEAEWKASYSKD